jgi:2-hydroxy-6-oxonona-2,4-dienedioate hydrolase
LNAEPDRRLGGGPELDEPPEGRRVEVDDVYFHVIEAGVGDPLLFLHGGGPGSSGWTDFGFVLPRFAATRRCVLVDILQYGGSSKDEIVGPRWSYHAARLAGLIDALGFARVDLVCNSWGGSIALCLAAERPHLVGRLVVTGCVPVLSCSPALLRDGARRGRAARDAYYGGTRPSLEGMRTLMAEHEWFAGERVPESLVRRRYEQSLDPEEMKIAGHSDTARGDPQDLSDAMPAITAPVLYLWGMHDPFVSPEYALMLARLTSGGEMHALARSAHHPQEERPDAFYRVVSAFLE